MNKITKKILDEKRKEKVAGAEVSFRECLFEDMDLTGYDLSDPESILELSLALRLNKFMNH